MYQCAIYILHQILLLRENHPVECPFDDSSHLLSLTQLVPLLLSHGKLAGKPLLVKSVYIRVEIQLGERERQRHRENMCVCISSQECIYKDINTISQECIYKGILYVLSAKSAYIRVYVLSAKKSAYIRVYIFQVFHLLLSRHREAVEEQLALVVFQI